MPFLDPLHVAIALAPLATYLLVLGSLYLSRRPLVVTGGRDLAALAVAIAGFAVVGPMELFLVEEAAVDYGPLVWALMLTAYVLLVALVILVQRPRLVIYNISVEQLRPVLADVVLRLDSDARWAGESLVMPQLGVQLYVEFSPAFHQVQLVAAGGEQHLAGWKRLEKALAGALQKSRTSTRRLGAGSIVAGLALMALVAYVLSRDPAGVMQAMNEMLRR